MRRGCSRLPCAVTGMSMGGKIFGGCGPRTCSVAALTLPAISCQICRAVGTAAAIDHREVFEAMALDAATVKRIAFLARVRVPEEDLKGLAGELSNILGWVEQLSEVDTDGVEPMSSVNATILSMRTDVITDGDDLDRVLANAPEREGSFFAVPKVIE